MHKNPHKMNCVLNKNKNKNCKLKYDSEIFHIHFYTNVIKYNKPYIFWLFNQ